MTKSAFVVTKPTTIHELSFVAARRRSSLTSRLFLCKDLVKMADTKLYDILGVNKNSSEGEIKKVIRSYIYINIFR